MALNTHSSLQKKITLIFISSDFIALILQSTGGGIADNANVHSVPNEGTHIMVAGLAFQVLSLVCFVVLSGEFLFRVYQDKKVVAREGKQLRGLIYGEFSWDIRK